MSEEGTSATAESPTKSAQAGTVMFRRADVRGKIMKLRQFNRRAMKLALQEGRQADADIHLGKVRSMVALLNDLDKLPLFENPAAVDAMSPIDAALRGD